MFKVLRPMYQKTGEVSRAPDGRDIRWERVRWIERGYAADMEHAKQQFGGCPVLEAIPIHVLELANPTWGRGVA